MSQGLFGKNMEVFSKTGMFVNVRITALCFVFLYCNITKSDACWQSWDPKSRIIKPSNECGSQTTINMPFTHFPDV